MTSPLAPQIRANPGSPASVRVGTVVGLSPPRVSVQGTILDDPGFLGWYAPAVGDTVVLLGQSSAAGPDPASWLVLGVANGSGAGFQAGSDPVTVAATTSAVLGVVFAVPYAAAPAVTTNIASGAGAVLNWGSRAINVTAVGFDIYIFGPSSSFTVEVQWQAQPLSQ